ncbi:MAG: glycosyltransferase family 39 protein [Candidatus Auribacterota bacterium]|nr:glycosyltransferase family 39 protein [Candidatus Auribacterota bacterium]
MNISEKTKKIPVWVILICLATLVFGIGDHDLWTPDEPREAAIAREMASGSDWLIPRLAGVPFVEKPPLYYWLSAGMVLLTGKIIGATAATRGLSALAAAGCLALIYFSTRPYLKKKGALSAMLILVTFYGLWRGAHWIIIDTVLAFFITAAVFLFFIGLDRDKKAALLAAYFAAGCGFLTKGPIAWVLIFLPWALMFFLYRGKIKKQILWHLTGILLLLGPSLVWALIFRLRAGEELWHEWFIINQIGRFTGEAAHLGHIKGPFYYLWLVPLILLPWTPVVIGWFAGKGWRQLREYPPGRRNLILLSLAWGLGGFLILSLPETKREVYFYPLLPAFALIALEGIRSGPKWTRTILLVISVIFAVPLLIFSFLSLDWVDSRLIWELAVNPIPLVGTLVAVLALLKLKRNPVARTAAIAALFYLAYSLIAHPIFNKVWSYKPATLELTRAIPPGYEDRVAIWMSDETSRGLFSFYSDLKLTKLSEGAPQRLKNILRGRDPEFSLAVIHRYDRFKNETELWPTWKVLAQKQKGRHRIFALIAGEDFNPDLQIREEK